MHLRVTFQYEADVAGGRAGEYASELNPVMHVFATHGLGISSPDDPDDGIVVISTGDLAKSAKETVTVDVPFNPAASQYARIASDANWALPGAHAGKSAEIPPADKPFQWPVPADASVSFNAYVETATQTGQSCRTRAGEALFLASELLALSEAGSGKPDVRAEWQITGQEPLVKGFVAVKSATLVINGHPLEHNEHVRFVSDSAAPAVFHLDDTDKGKAKAALETSRWLSERVNSSQDVFFGPGAPLNVSKPSYLRRMHCPYYNTSAGMLWGSTYTLRVPRGKPPVGYYEAALKAALVRCNASANDLLLASERQRASPEATLPSMHAYMETFSSMLSVYANTMVYLDDFTNDDGNTYLLRPDAGKSSAAGRMHLLHRRDIAGSSQGSEGRGMRGRGVPASPVQVTEDYKIARLGHGDDCEGVAKEIYVQYWQLRRADLAGNTDDSAEHQLLREFQGIARENTFTPMMVLAAVTNKKLDANVARDMTDEDAMAHTYTALVPTALVLDRMTDASPRDSRFSGLSKAVKGSEYAHTYDRFRSPWHAGLGVLVCEGTAKSSSLLLPTASYYEGQGDAKLALRDAALKLRAECAIARDLPRNGVQLEIPNTRMEDDNEDIANDRADASDFYKGNSAAYVSAFRDTGILDFAFAWADERTGALTHGIHFNRFICPSQWHPSVRIVPYNRLSEKEGAFADAALAQLEPIPALRRNPPPELPPVPEALASIRALFSQNAAPIAKKTASLQSDSAAMPPPARSVVVSVRKEDASEDVTKGVYEAVRANKRFFSNATVHVHYLSDPPVPGDETSLPPVVVYDVELEVAR